MSSMVEDAAFLLLKSLERSVSTHSTQAIMATVNRIADILDPLAPQPSFFSGLQSESVNITTFPPNALEQKTCKVNEKESFGEAFARVLGEDVEGMTPTAAQMNQTDIVIMNSSQVRRVYVSVCLAAWTGRAAGIIRYWSESDCLPPF